jgi:multidrug transporter EmrE-like cation transporter
MQFSKLLSIQVIVLIALLLLFDTFAQLAFKIAVTHLGEFTTQNLSVIWRYCLQLAVNPYVICGVIALIFALITWLTLISKVDLSFAHPMTSLVYVAIPLSATLFLNEPLHWYQLVGIVFIVVGVFVISDDVHTRASDIT